MEEAHGLVHEGWNPVMLAHTGPHLPAVTCIGEFHSGEFAKPDSEPYSSLVVVWFQDAFSPAVSETVVAQIEALDWEKLARDWIW